MVYKDIPLPGDLLTNSQSDIRGNFSQANTSFSVNHFGFSSVGNNGKHKIVTMPINVGVPATTVGDFCLFNTNFPPSSTPSQLLYTRDGSGTFVKITGPNDPVAATNGYTYLLGGILLQWGTISISSSSGSVSFATSNIVFPTNCFNVQLSFRLTGSIALTNTDTLAVNGVNKNNFTWLFNGTSTGTKTLFWTAIGN